jgi:hypothetical protein
MLSQRNDVWMPPRNGELHFFDREILKRPLSWYAGVFDNPAIASSLAGEKTPSYSTLKPRSIRLIRTLMPRVKLILLLRRPEERAWSHARMEASRYNRESLASEHVAGLIFRTGTLRNTRRTSYARTISRWLKHFPPNQLFVGFHEEIRTDPSAFLDRVLDFLGLAREGPHDIRQLRQHVWKSPEVKMPEAVRWCLKRRYRTMVRDLARRYRGAQTWLEAASETARVPWKDKLKAWAIGHVCTVPYNLAYLVYDLCRDIRMWFRIRAVLREARLGPCTGAARDYEPSTGKAAGIRP